MVLKLVAGQHHDSYVGCDSSQEKMQDNTCTIFIHRDNSMGFLSGFTEVHRGTLVYDNTIFTTLHCAQKMMVQIRHINGLVDNKVVLQDSERVHIGEGTTDCDVLICTKRGVIPLDIDRTIVIIQFEDSPP